MFSVTTALGSTCALLVARGCPLLDLRPPPEPVRNCWKCSVTPDAEDLCSPVSSPSQESLSAEAGGNERVGRPRTLPSMPATVILVPESVSPGMVCFPRRAAHAATRLKCPIHHMIMLSSSRGLNPRPACQH